MDEVEEAVVPRLRVEGVDAGYGRVQVLFGLDLEVAVGETVAVLGANGAGKTTLLRAISGLLTPTAGTIALDGRDLAKLSADARARRGIVHVRGADVFAGLTVDENLRASLVAHPDARRDADARMARVYDVFPALAAHRKQDAASMSGGEQQMLALGCALLHEPTILLVDELSLGLAPLVVQRLIDVLRGLHDAGLTMLVVEQSLAVAARLTDRVVFVEKGSIRFDGAPGDLMEEPELARAVFLGAARDPGVP